MYCDYCDSKAWLLRSTILQLSRRVARITSSGYYRQRAHHYILLGHIDTSSAEMLINIDMGSRLVSHAFAGMTKLPLFVRRRCISKNFISTLVEAKRPQITKTPF